jgi:polynucleotide 5'-kinase involved in rRNA processing
MDSVGYEVPGVALDRAKLDVLNGSIVGLLSEDENSDSCCCLGLGIVRAIDRVQRLFYILTPVGHGCLKDVKMLRKGTLELPIECLNRGKYSEGFPYLACKRKVLGLGGEAMKSRNNIVRRRFAD